MIKTKKVQNEHYFIRQDNTIYKCMVKLSFSSIGQDKSKLQKQISMLFILIEVLLDRNDLSEFGTQSFPV